MTLHNTHCEPELPAPRREEQWSELKRLVAPQVYPPGSLLHMAGEIAHDGYVIGDGAIKLVRHGNGREQIIGLRTTGWLVGTAALLTESRHTSTAQTVTRSVLYRIPAPQFRRLARTHDRLSWQIHQMLSEELRLHEDHLAAIGCCRVRHRLENCLWNLCKSVDMMRANGSGLRLAIPLKNWELAQLVTTSPEHLSRVLRQLEAEELIARRKGWIEVQDPDRLWHREV